MLEKILVQLRYPRDQILDDLISEMWEQLKKLNCAFVFGFDGGVYLSY